MSHKIKFYPVGNGDNVLLKLTDGFTAMFDCQIRKPEKKDDGTEVYDVKKDLMEELQTVNGKPFVDLFVNSHPHEDHCLGYDANFYHGDPDDYGDTNKENEEIIIGELWVTQKVFQLNLCDDANAIRNEANRRLRLFRSGDAKADKLGNRIHIIGYNDEDKIEEGIHYIPGSTIYKINGKYLSGLNIFIHAPLKSDIQTSWADKDENIASIVMQLNINSEQRVSRVFICGDADHYVFEHIMDISEAKSNEDALKWDILLAPHHCSWSFFNDTPQKDHPDVVDSASKFLGYANEGAHIVSSSNKIEDNDNNPPHFQARKQYIKTVTAERFKNTAINGGEKKPQPIVYEFDSDGITFKRALSYTGTTTILGSSTPRAGLWMKSK